MEEAVPSSVQQDTPFQRMSGEEFERLQLFQAGHNEGLRIQERNRTIRTLGLCATILVGLQIIGGVIVRVTEQPPWVQGLALIVGAAPGSAALTAMFWRFRFYLKRYQSGKIELESSVDAGRTSSGLNSDGTADND